MKFPFFNKAESNKIKSLEDSITNLQDKLEDAGISEEFLLEAYSKGAFSADGDDGNSLGSSFGLVDEFYDKASLQKLYCTEGWFFVVVHTIAKTLASTPQILEKKKITKQEVSHADGSKETVHKETWIDATGEPEFQVFQYPNTFQTPIEFWMLVVIDLLATGDAFIYTHKRPVSAENTPEERLRGAINRVRKTDVEGLYRLNSALISPVVSQDDGRILEAYEMSADCGTYRFEVEDIIHLRLPNPCDAFYGLAPIVPVMKNILLDRYSTEHMMRFYKQGARLGGAVETNKKLTPDQIVRLERTFTSNYTGKRNHHKTLILPEGMKYTPIEQNPGESSLIEFMKNNKQPIFSAYNVPPIKVGLLDGATFSNAMIQNKTYYVDTIMPIAQLISQGLTQSDSILKSNRNLRIRYDFSNIEALQEDMQMKAQTAASMLLSGMSVNEVRERVWELGPVDGGAVIPAIQRATSPYTTLSGPKIDSKVDPSNNQNDNEALSDLIETRTTFQNRVATLVMQAIEAGVDPQIAVEQSIVAAIQEGYAFPEISETAPKPEVEEAPAEEDKAIQHNFSKEMLDRTVEKLVGAGVAGLINKRETEAKEFFSRLEKFIISKIKKKAFRKGTSFVVKASLPSQSDLTTFIKTESDKIAESMLDSTKHGFSNNLSSQSMPFQQDAANKILAKFATRNVTSVVQSSLSTLKNIISTSFDEGVGVNELAARIEESFNGISTSKATTIARTETLSAVSIGQELKRLAFKKAFPKEAKGMKRLWLSAKDDKVRDSHENVDGEVVEAGKKFANGLKFPREPGAPAEEVINCRCTFVDFLEEDEDLINAIADDESPLAEN